MNKINFNLKIGISFCLKNKTTKKIICVVDQDPYSWLEVVEVLYDPIPLNNPLKDVPSLPGIHLISNNVYHSK